jgi:hypothetical protein
MTLALVSKLNQLEYTVKNGMQSDEMLSTFELQIKQFKQILKEIEVAETFDKPTLSQVPSDAKSSETIKPKFDINSIIKNLNF